MNESALVALAVVIFGWAILSDWFARHDLTGPLVFMVAGLVLANSDWGIGSVDIEGHTVHALAEVTLALLLFGDASGVPPAAARRDVPLTARLLAIGLPLSILAGTAAAVVLFPSLPLALAGVIAASLAPTDAALSAPVIADERLPARVRRILNVESGLNDGIATPVVTFCIASAAAAIGVVGDEHEDGFGALGQLLIGVGVGAAVAFIGGRLIVVARQRGWMQHGSRRLATLAVALLAFLVASEAGGNPFVSAFVGGIVFGATATTDAVESVELTELAGSLLSLVLWFIFGAGFVIPAFEDLDARIVAVCRRQPDRRPHGAGGTRPPRSRTRSADDDVHRLVRPARAGLRGLRPAGRGGVGRHRPPGPRRRQHDHRHDRVQHHRSWHHGPPAGDPLRRRARANASPVVDALMRKLAASQPFCASKRRRHGSDEPASEQGAVQPRSSMSARSDALIA